jgi:hypothetical protein
MNYESIYKTLLSQTDLFYSTKISILLLCPLTIVFGINVHSTKVMGKIYHGYTAYKIRSILQHFRLKDVGIRKISP